jgi:Fe-S-cluster-containing hydrogenase component 2
MMCQIVIDNSKCDGCQLCLAACGRGALKLTADGIVHNDSCDCQECRKCEYICACGAISWTYQVVEG